MRQLGTKFFGRITFWLCREQAAVEKRRHTPEGGRVLHMLAGDATRMDGGCLSETGPHGVSWLMGAFDMPNNTQELRLMHLTSGDVHVLRTIGRHPDSPMEDDEEEEEEEEEEEAESKEHTGSQAAAEGEEVSGQAAAVNHAEVGAEAGVGGQSDGAEEQRHQGICAGSRSSVSHLQQSLDSSQPSSERQDLNPALQPQATSAPCDTALDHPGPAASPPHTSSGAGLLQGHEAGLQPARAAPDASAAGTSGSAPIPAGAMNTSDSISALSTSQQSPNNVPSGGNDVSSIGAKPCGHQIKACPEYYQQMPWAVLQDDAVPAASVPAKFMRLNASSQPGDDPGSHFYRLPNLGLGLDDEISVWHFLADGRHMFLQGEPLENPFRLMCWQVLSIPDGRTTVCVWKSYVSPTRLHAMAGKWISTQIKDSVVTYDMKTLLPWRTINLRRVLREAADAELDPCPHLYGRDLECNERSLAVAVHSGLRTWVLVFEVSSGALQATCAGPTGYEVRTMKWIAPEPFSVVAVQYYKHRPACGPVPMARDLVVMALHVSSSEQIKLSRAHLVGTRFWDKLIWPAPGGTLVLALNWLQGRRPQLRVMDLNTGASLWRCQLRHGEETCYLNSKPRAQRICFWEHSLDLHSR